MGGTKLFKRNQQARELAFDPWRAQQAALELEREGLTCVVWPQTDARACPASDRLHRALVEGKLTLPDDPKLAEHAANAVQRHSRRGWRLDAPSRTANIDGIVALMMALDRLGASSGAGAVTRVALVMKTCPGDMWEWCQRRCAQDSEEAIGFRLVTGLAALSPCRAGQLPG